jgi:hypothetical protein
MARSERALWRLSIADPEYGSLGYAGFADCPVLEGRYTLAVLFEYAATLGLFATLIANDLRLRCQCHRIGDRHLAVAVDREPEFRKALGRRRRLVITMLLAAGGALAIIVHFGLLGSCWRPRRGPAGVPTSSWRSSR